MTNSDEELKSSSPPGWVLASQWGMNLVVLTCFFGYLGFWIGEKLQNKALSFFLTLLGIMLGFGAGVWRMVKAAEKFKQSGPAGKSDESDEK